AKGRWYFKVWLGRDPLTGRQQQVTQRGFGTAAEAAQARRTYVDAIESGGRPVARGAMTLNDLLDTYLDGLDADGHQSPKTRFDYRRYADGYIRPWIGQKRVRELTGATILAWQRQLLQSGGTKSGKPLSANTIRLARAPLSGALKAAVSSGV